METLLEMWKRSIRLPGLHTFNEAQKECPEGYRVPTDKELKWILANTRYSFDKEKKEGVFTFSDDFELRLPAAGNRDRAGNSRY